MLAKLGNMDAADATSKMTAVLNAYNMTAEDSIKIVDSLVALDNSLAVSTEGIASGMQQSASFARQAGVSYSDLAAQVATIVDITQKSGDTVGNALN
jgi:TP901 family phage tail tape measure protein